jgi:hypothetical protein
LDANYADDELTIKPYIVTSSKQALCGECKLDLEDGTIDYLDDDKYGDLTVKLDHYITINKNDYTDVYFSVNKTSGNTTIQILTSGNNYNFCKEDGTGDRSFTVSGGLVSGTRYTVKRIVGK